MESMSGFGMIQKNFENFNIEVSLKSVNSKFCDVSSKIPRCLYEIENKIIGLVKKRLKRGKIYLNILLSNYEKQSVVIDENLIKELKKSYEVIKNIFDDVKYNLDYSNILRIPEVLRVESIAVLPDNFVELILDCLNETCDKLIETRQNEGKNLFCFFETELNLIYNNIEKIEKLVPETKNIYAEKLKNNFKLIEIEEPEFFEKRIMSELSYFCDKIDISEELVRLKSHIKEFKRYINISERCMIGRTLEFLVQEMNREINTCTVKSVNSEISKLGVKIKSSLDKLKEQVMNLV